jgi:hypothetical protein
MNYVYFTSVTWRYDIRRQLSIFDSKCALRRVSFVTIHSTAGDNLRSPIIADVRVTRRVGSKYFHFTVFRSLLYARMQRMSFLFRSVDMSVGRGRERRHRARALHRSQHSKLCRSTRLGASDRTGSSRSSAPKEVLLVHVKYRGMLRQVQVEREVLRDSSRCRHGCTTNSNPASVVAGTVLRSSVSCE